ncbi:MAG: PIN domain-containing protein [Planctomycetaceae bacterium]|nr:PIN domain-containing protein [Planctomycetaceae bacterium]
MNEVFADTFYFLALLNRYDQHHTAAVRAAYNLQFRLVTTHWILAEVADALSVPPHRLRVASFIRGVFSNRAIEVVSDPLSCFVAGLSLYERRADKSWSLTDCISFAVMDAKGIRQALTADRHFEQAGFVPMLASPGA